MSDTCAICGNLVAEPGASYGYSGQVCRCGDAWRHYEQQSAAYVATVEAHLLRMQGRAREVAELTASTMSGVDLSQQTRSARTKLFATGFLQVIFVAANTVFISHYELMANLITAFLISLIWTWNVKKIAFGDTADRWAYATGAALGSVAGTIVATRLLASMSA